MFKIHCGDDIELLSESREVFSTLFIENDGVFFPAYGWTDFSVAIFECLVDYIVSALANGQNKFSLYFEDGPWYLDVELRNNLFIFHGIDNHVDGRCVCEFSISQKDFLAELNAAIRHLHDKLMDFKEDTFGAISRLKRMLNKLN